MTAQTAPDWPVWGWPERRLFDLERSHHVSEHVNDEDREHARRLCAQVVEYEALARAMEKQGATAEEMERIEDAAWPVREVLRQLDEKLAEFADHSIAVVGCQHYGADGTPVR